MKIMKHIVALLLSLITACSNSDGISSTDNDDEIWVMIKTDAYFRGQKELEIVDTISEIIESKELGYLDGHSSGGFQFDFNFTEVTNWDKAKSEIDNAINENYPTLEYTISSTYETTYDKL